jgi:hypothetical protein
MLTRILVIAALALAVAAPAALAGGGAPPPNASAPQGARAHAAGGGQIQQRLTQLRQKLVAAETAFRRHCVQSPANVDRCTAAAKRMLAALQKIDSRIDALVTRIEQRCGSSAGAAAPPPACSRADQVVQVLHDAQSRIQQLEQELQGWLANPPAAAPSGKTGSNSGASGDSSSAGGDGLESLDQLSSDLAAARDAAAQSGL